MANIEEPQQGGSIRKLWRVVKTLCRLWNGFEVKPTGLGKLIVAGEKVILSLDPDKFGGSSPLPDANAGDMMVSDGANWVVLANPGSPVDGDWILRHNGSMPYWDSVTTCDSGS